MTQYIDKSAVVAEIERRIKKYATIDVGKSSKLDAIYGAKCKALMEILSFLDTLEVKEVELEEAARNYLLHEHISPLNEVFHQSDIKAEMQYHKDIENAFKMGFELGLKTKTGGQAMKVNYQWHNAPKELPDSDCICLTYYNGRYHVNVWNSYYKVWDDSEGDYCEFESTEKLDWIVLEVEGGNQ